MMIRLTAGITIPRIAVKQFPQFFLLACKIGRHENTSLRLSGAVFPIKTPRCDHHDGALPYRSRGMRVAKLRARDSRNPERALRLSGGLRFIRGE